MNATTTLLTIDITTTSPNGRALTIKNAHKKDPQFSGNSESCLRPRSPCARTEALESKNPADQAIALLAAALKVFGLS